MHLRLGQAAWHPAKNQAPRHPPCRRGLPAQPHRLQPGPHSEAHPSLMAPPAGLSTIRYKMPLQANSTGLLNQPTDLVHQRNNEIQSFFSKLLEKSSAASIIVIGTIAAIEISGAPRSCASVKAALGPYVKALAR